MCLVVYFKFQVILGNSVLKCFYDYCSGVAGLGKIRFLVFPAASLGASYPNPALKELAANRAKLHDRNFRTGNKYC